MDIAAIATTLVPDVSGSSRSVNFAESVRQFDALLLQILVREARLFHSGDAAGSIDGDDQAIGSLFDQILAVQLSQSLDLGIGRTALGRTIGDIE